ncbi:hypothetical protein [Neobacillus niacini]|uniref:hypothetical protein n=1 Tax=Neobacillus niacini TaxID=86668 RepID=UPI000A67B164|nr:hypothetical protein [Neobacillus niacini]
MEVILVTAWVMEAILVTAWVMEVIHSIIMDMVAILSITDTVAILFTIIMDFITGTVVNFQNGFNPWSDVFRGFKLSLKGF